MNDLLYFLVGPIVIGIFGLLYKWTERTWSSISDEEIHKIWDANVENYGNVVQFARDLERKLEDRNT